MKNQNTNENQKSTQGLNSRVSVFYAKEQDAIVHLAGEITLTLPANYYRARLGREFTPQSSPESLTRPRVFGATVRNVPVYFSRDRKFLIHRIFGQTIVLPVKLYEAILDRSEENRVGVA